MVYQFVRGRTGTTLSLRVFLITLLPPSGHFLVTLALAECLRYHGGGSKMGMFRCGVGYGRGEGGDRAIGWVENEDGITYFSFQLLFRLWMGLYCWSLIVYH